jgi:hypothetical protein
MWENKGWEGFNTAFGVIHPVKYFIIVTWVDSNPCKQGFQASGKKEATRYNHLKRRGYKLLDFKSVSSAMSGNL